MTRPAERKTRPRAPRPCLRLSKASSQNSPNHPRPCSSQDLLRACRIRQCCSPDGHCAQSLSPTSRAQPRMARRRVLPYQWGCFSVVMQTPKRVSLTHRAQTHGVWSSISSATARQRRSRSILFAKTPMRSQPDPHPGAVSRAAAPRPKSGYRARSRTLSDPQRRRFRSLVASGGRSSARPRAPTPRRPPRRRRLSDAATLGQYQQPGSGSSWPASSSLATRRLRAFLARGRSVTGRSATW